MKPRTSFRSFFAREPAVDIEQNSPGENFSRASANHYGPAETIVVTTWVSIPPLASKGGTPPIGRSVANSKMRRLLPYFMARQLRLGMRAPIASPTLTGLVPLAAERQRERGQQSVILIALRSSRHPSADLRARLDRFSDAESESLFAKARSQRPAPMNLFSETTTKLKPEENRAHDR